MRIPNSFITDLRSNYTDFAVACKLYSLVSSHTSVAATAMKFALSRKL